MERQAPDQSSHADSDIAQTSCQNHLPSPSADPSENTHHHETIWNPPSYAEAILLPSYKGDAPPSMRSVTQQFSLTTTLEFHTPTTAQPVQPPSTHAQQSVNYIAAPSPQQPSQQYQQPQVVSVWRISSFNISDSILHIHYVSTEKNPLLF